MTGVRRDGRTRLPPNQVVTEKFPVMTAGTPATATTEDWTLRLGGDVDNPIILDWQSFLGLPQQNFVVDIHCVTRWSKLDTIWRGVSFDVLADLARPKPDAQYVQASADAGYSANLRFKDLVGGKAFIAVACDGKPLMAVHGGPVRLIIPDLYFWKSVKWLRGLQFGPYDIKGYWEKLGYHNYGDPWLEQRYRG